MKKAASMQFLGALAFLGVGLLLTGCKPELTQANAQALIQAKYDQTPAVGASITVDDLGMRQGVAAGYWNRTTVYPNKYWADFTLTAAGKKAVKLHDGTDVIKWRPASATDKKYSAILVTAVANHLKARDVKAPESETPSTKSVSFNEAFNFDGVPDGLQNIAHNPGNKLSTKRQAEFTLEGGAWKLSSIQ